jgi:hypothetical protein
MDASFTSISHGNEGYVRGGASRGGAPDWAEIAQEARDRHDDDELGLDDGDIRESDRFEQRKKEERRNENAEPADMGVKAEDLDAGTVVDLSGGAVGGDTLSLDINNADESAQVLADDVAGRERLQHDEEASADMARDRRAELMLAHDSLDASFAQNTEADDRLHQAIDRRSAFVDHAVARYQKLAARYGDAARQRPGVERMLSRVNLAISHCEVLSKGRSVSQANLRNAADLRHHNAVLQAQARENERQHMANSRKAFEQAQELRHLMFQMGTRQGDPDRTDRKVDGLAQAGPAGLENGRPLVGLAAAQESCPTAAPQAAGSVSPPSWQLRARAARPSGAGSGSLHDDGAGEKRQGPSFHLSTVGQRLIVDLARMERPALDTVA